MKKDKPLNAMPAIIYKDHLDSYNKRLKTIKNKSGHKEEVKDLKLIIKTIEKILKGSE